MFSCFLLGYLLVSDKNKKTRPLRHQWIKCPHSKSRTLALLAAFPAPRARAIMPPVHLRALVLVTAVAIVTAGPAPPLAPHGHSGLLNLGDCYAMTETLPITGGPVNCAATTAREADGCFLLCGICAVPALRFGLAAAERKSLCSPPAAGDANLGCRHCRSAARPSHFGRRFSPTDGTSAALTGSV